MRRLRTSDVSSGFSLVELLVVAALLAIVFGSIALVGQTTDRAYSTGTTAAMLEQQVAAAMKKITSELEMAMSGTVDPDPGALGADQMTYSQAVGIAGSQVLESPRRRLAFEYESGEVDDGVDNNGNGLVDEGLVVLREDFGGPEERRRVLTRWVMEHLAGESRNGIDDNGNGLLDEAGFCLSRQGETYVVRLSLRRTDSRGRVLTRSAQSAVRMRN